MYPTTADGSCGSAMTIPSSLHIALAWVQVKEVGKILNCSDPMVSIPVVLHDARVVGFSVVGSGVVGSSVVGSGVVGSGVVGSGVVGSGATQQYPRFPHTPLHLQSFFSILPFLQARFFITQNPPACLQAFDRLHLTFLSLAQQVHASPFFL